MEAILENWTKKMISNNNNWEQNKMPKHFRVLGGSAFGSTHVGIREQFLHYEIVVNIAGTLAPLLSLLQFLVIPNLQREKQ